MFGVEYTRMEKRVERIVKLRIFELMIEHENEETVES